MSIQYQTQVLPFVVTNFKGHLSPTKMTSSHTSPTCVGSYSTIKQFFIASLLIWLVHNFAFGNISPTRLRPASALSEETHDLLLIADVLLIPATETRPSSLDELWVMSTGVVSLPKYLRRLFRPSMCISVFSLLQDGLQPRFYIRLCFFPSLILISFLQQFCSFMSSLYHYTPD